MDAAACKKLFDLCSQSLSSTEVGIFGYLKGINDDLVFFIE